MEIEMGGDWYKTIYDDSGQCHNCCARNDSRLCAGLSAVGECANNLFVFQPKEFNQPVVNSTAEATSVLNEPKTDQNTIVWVKSEVPSEEYNPVSKPKHYMLVPGVEVRDICKAMADRMEGKYSSFFISDYIQFLQYVLRFDQKNGIEDLKKAEWYLQKLIETENKE